MYRASPICLSLLFVAGCAGLRSRAAPNGSSSEIHALSWLSGQWVGGEGETRLEETWGHPLGRTMLGTNRTINNGDTVHFEYLRIEERPDGIYYLASPGGRYPPTSFKMKELTSNRVVFENLYHDYPQRVIYRRDGRTLHGRIEGRRYGEEKLSEWSWQQAR